MLVSHSIILGLVTCECVPRLVPSAAPTSVSVLANVTSSSITVQWGAVDCADRNGDITGYSVQYTGGGSTQTMNVSGDSSGGMVTISGLSPATLYTVEVAAVNSAGPGVYSDPLPTLTSGNALTLLVYMTALKSNSSFCSSTSSGDLSSTTSRLHGLPQLD